MRIKQYDLDVDIPDIVRRLTLMGQDQALSCDWHWLIIYHYASGQITQENNKEDREKSGTIPFNPTIIYSTWAMKTMTKLKKKVYPEANQVGPLDLKHPLFQY